MLLCPDADREAIVASWQAFLEQRGVEHEVIVSDNPAGEGAALRDGLGQARHPLICTALCRAEYRPEYLGQLLERPFTPEEPPQDGADPGKEIDHVHLMSGFRAGVKVPWAWRIPAALWRTVAWLILSYSSTPLPGWLGWRRHLGALLARIFFGVRYRDVTCPFRLFRREILARLPIQSDSAFAHMELVAKANSLTCIMTEEVPLDIRPGPYRGDAGLIWKEARRLFNKPTFGPPPQVEASTVAEGATSPPTA